jgi:DDE superfamily endonuclease
MYLNTLKQYRQEMYDCLLKAKDALFNTVDALSTETMAKSLPEVTQSLWFERDWSSIYEAFEDGRLDQSRLRQVFTRHMPKPAESNWLWMGIDASGIARPFSATAADRTAMPVHNLPKAKKAITFGWHFSTVVVLPEPTSSRTFILDQQRITSETTAIQTAVEQLRHLVRHLPQKTIVVLDRGYDANWLWCQCSDLGIGILGRLKAKRRFYRPAPPPTGKRGGPRKDGPVLQVGNASTYGTPDGQYDGTDQKERPIQISWWNHLHIKDARWLEVTVMQIVRPLAKNSERDSRISWFVWIGDPAEDLVQIAKSYALRFGQEHGYRFDKQALLWEKPRLRTPQAFALWSQVVAMAHNQLVLATPLVEPVLRPWESKHRPASLQQVRRGFSKLLIQLGTPARPPKHRGKAKGRQKGAVIPKAKRFPVILKTPKLPPLVPK